MGTGNDGQLQTAADTATPAEDEALSPRARSLREVFDSLSAGRDVLAHEALVKWDYVAVAIERGLVSQYQVTTHVCFIEVLRSTMLITGHLSKSVHYYLSTSLQFERCDSNFNAEFG